jgi:hypothetical protein
MRFSVDGPWMLSALHLDGFKSFGRRQTVPLRPLTLLFGANSAGKSTVLQTLYLLRQSITADHPSMHLALRGDRVIRSFGHFRDVLNHGRFGQHDRTFMVGYSTALRDGSDGKEQCVEYEVGIPKNPESPYLPVRRVTVGSEDGDAYWFEPRQVDERSAGRQLTAKAVVNAEHPFWARFPQAPEDAPKLEEARAGLRQSDSEYSSSSKAVLAARSAPGVGFYWSRCGSLKPRVLGEEAEAYWPVWNEPYHALQRTIGRLLYVAPLRDLSSRDLFLPVSGRACFTTADHGEILPWSAWGFDDIPGTHERKQLVDKVNQWLERLGIQLAVHWQELATKQDGSDVRAAWLGCRSTERSEQRNAPPPPLMHFSDVGFGVSQVLPIVANLMMTKSRLVTIEQPEVHVHPALQAELGNCLAEAVVNQGHQVICETHSEHLVLRIQKLIRTGKLDPSLVQVCSINRGQDGSAEIYPISFSGSGIMEGTWPGGFFAERSQELF